MFTFTHAYIHVFLIMAFFRHRLQVLANSGDLQGQLSVVHISWFLKAIALLPREHGAWVIIYFAFPFWDKKRQIFTGVGDLLLFYGRCFLAISGLGEDTLDVQILGWVASWGIQQVEDDVFFAGSFRMMGSDFSLPDNFKNKVEIGSIGCFFVCSFDC